MELPRKQTRQLTLGSVRIGGGAPIVVQSMANTDTRDVEATLGQIKRLHDAGCEIVRVAVPDETAARALRAIHDASLIPVIADIHFDYRLDWKAYASTPATSANAKTWKWWSMPPKRGAR